jgi:membrane associated rhomboid family serine protease
MTVLEDIKLQLRSGDVIIRLIAINIALFVVPAVAGSLLILLGINYDFLAFARLSSDAADLLWKPWSLVSYAFFHGGFFHLLFNVLMLHFAGRLFLTFFTQKQLLGLYLVGGIFSGLIFLSAYALFPPSDRIPISLVGASGSIMAILLATTVYAPMMSLRLFLFGQVKLWYITVIILIIDIIQLPLSNTGGHLAHLGGALFGYMFIKSINNGHDLVSWLPNSLDNIVGFFEKKPRRSIRTVHKDSNRSKEKKTSRIIIKDRKQQQIDDILDKIGRSGYDSLSKEEKDFLFRAGEK